MQLAIFTLKLVPVCPALWNIHDKFVVFPIFQLEKSKLIFIALEDLAKSLNIPSIVVAEAGFHFDKSPREITAFPESQQSPSNIYEKFVTLLTFHFDKSTVKVFRGVPVYLNIYDIFVTLEVFQFSIPVSCIFEQE
jgi:hypothetical protein